jgi:HlyD family secretion protein
MPKPPFKLVAIIIIISVIAVFSWQSWQQKHDQIPSDFASGNGRIEADQVDVTTKYAGRVKQLFVQEGDLVTVGQILATMDTIALDADLAQAQAQLAQTHASVIEGEAVVKQRESELKLARLEYERVLPLAQKGSISQSSADQKQTVFATANAALAAAKAHTNTLRQSVNAAKAAVTRIQTQIDDSTLTAPVMGRVLYRLAQPSEVFPSGGKVLTLINLGEIYMEVFLPSAQAYLTPIGSEARIKLDMLDFAVPAKVSFVSPISQFTPKQVETLDERDKLMFRVKVRVPHELVLSHINQVKTGVRGVAYIRLMPQQGLPPSPWPGFLTQLPPQPAPELAPELTPEPTSKSTLKVQER